MPNLADVTAFNGETTPVATVFVADHVEYANGTIKALWGAKLPGVPEYAQQRMTLTSRTTSGGIRRVGLRIDIPYMETPNGATTQGYTAPAKVAYTESNEDVQWIHPRSLYQGRLNVRSLMRNMRNNLATTQTPVTTGFMHDAMVNLVFPS